jgi:hypothetical protein
MASEAINTYVKGKITGVQTFKTKQKQEPFKLVQILTNGGARAGLIDVKDYQNRDYQVGDEAVIYCSVSVWKTERSMGLNIMAHKDQSSCSALLAQGGKQEGKRSYV